MSQSPSAEPLLRVRDPSIALSFLLGSFAIAAFTSGACSQSNQGARDASAAGGAFVGGSFGHGGVTTAAAAGGRGGSGGAGGADTGGSGAGDGGTSNTGGTLAGGTGGRTGTGGQTDTGGSRATGGATGTGSLPGAGGNSDAGQLAKDAGQVFADAPSADSALKDAPATDATTAQSCPTGQPAPTAGNKKTTLQHGGRSRTYTLHVPSGLRAGLPLAVVFDFHGAGSNGSQQQGMSGWASLGDREGFLTVFPDGVDGYWNVDDKCCGTAGKSRIDDIGFLRAILDQLRADLCIDAKRVYATGFSNGGGFTHRVGCDAADVIAAIAPVATDLRTQPCNAARPISMIEVRGMADSLEPYEGGLVGPEGGQYVLVGAKESLKLWAAINKCTDNPTEMEKYCEGHTQCEAGVETDLCSLPNVDHSPYSNSLGFNVAATAWKVFQRQPMR